MMVKFPLVPFATCLLHLQLLVPGSFNQEEVKQPYRRDTQRPAIMNYLVPPEAPNHLPLVTLPCLPEQYNHCGKNFSRKTSLSKHMLVIHGASSPSKIQKYRYMVKFKAHRRISFAIFYTFKTRISFKEHMKRGAHLQAPGPACVGGRFVREFMLLLDGICVGGTTPKRERGFTPVMSVTRLSSP